MPTIVVSRANFAIFTFLFAFLVVILSINALVAETSIEAVNSEFPSVKIHISGTISKSDADFIAQRDTELRYAFVEIYLDSQGGDVSAALRIGRAIRKYEGFTLVEESRRCYSSCALIFIAGVKRFNWGSIGLHRPYLASTPQSRQTIEREAPQMLQNVKTYIQEMGVTDRFYQEMVNADPSGMKVYNSENIRDVVPETDPTFDEILISFNARKYGVDTVEMRKRFVAADRCPMVDYYFACREAILHGIDPRPAKDRWQQNGKCDFTDDEVKTLRSMTPAERRDHPLTLKQESCRRSIYTGG
jgi:hypothetical protein